MEDAFLHRLKDKARSNQLVVAIGDRFAGHCSLANLYRTICSHFEEAVQPEVAQDIFFYWNQLASVWEERGTSGLPNEQKVARIRANRVALMSLVEARAKASPVKTIHRQLAALPVSNFIDTTWSQQLLAAMTAMQRQSVVHTYWSHRLGGWSQTPVGQPNVFLSFLRLGQQHPFMGLAEHVTPHRGCRMQLENMIEMVRGKDLLLLDFTPAEAKHMLHLGALAPSADKVVNTSDPSGDYRFWAKCGTVIADVDANATLQKLLPAAAGAYGAWDSSVPGRMLIEVARDRQFDCFLSHSTEDRAFVDKLRIGLLNGRLRPWQDSQGIHVGHSLPEKLEAALHDCYTMVVVLSPASVKSEWVRREIRLADSLRKSGRLEILPIAIGDCEIPPELQDLHRADFRDPNTFAASLMSLLEAGRSAIARLQRKS